MSGQIFPRLDEARVMFQEDCEESWRLYEMSGPLNILPTHCTAAHAPRIGK